MRIIKDRTEIRNIQHAVDITARALRATFLELAACVSEHHAAARLESHFVKLGADGPAFQSIVAAGKNATTLHHRPGLQPLWKRELVLFDVGALYRGYSGDITRTIPVSGTFNAQQAKVYDIVYDALQAGLAKSGPGGCLDDIHHAAVRVLTAGLVALGVLKGNTMQLVAQRAYFPYYMHHTSHWLGLDVHDVSPTIAGGEEFSAAFRPLQPGMVFTVEPGLYFRHDDESVPKAYRGLGIRLEENVLISSSGHELLSRGIPASRTEIESLFQ
jgi:Xaa-Pro aminopeptidase